MGSYRKRAAIFSRDRKYRYRLTRLWSPPTEDDRGLLATQ